MVVNGMVKPSAPPAASIDPVSIPTPKERLHSLIERDMQLLDALGLEGLVKLKRPEGISRCWITWITLLTISSRT